MGAMTRLRPEYSRLRLHEVGAAAPVSGPPIVLTCDEGFLFQLQVALVSIFLNSPSRTLDIAVLAFDWQDDSVAVIDRLARKFGRPTTIIRGGEALLPPAFGARRERRAGFLRLMIPEILAGERFLYLDADVIAQIDIDEIWRDGRDGKLCGGVPDPTGKAWVRYQGFPDVEVYVNSGVLLLNGTPWRAERALARCAEWLARHPNRVLGDQDTINGALAGSIYALPPRWNVIAINQPGEWRLDLDSFRGIAHFAGRAKPWMRWCEPALQQFYLHYARIIGLPAGYWIESRHLGELMREAVWLAQEGDIAKANTLNKRAAELALAKLKKLDPNAEVDVTNPKPRVGRSGFRRPPSSAP
jgi:lipopolysaccharide biosynthesis glycosyltransferase